MKKLIPIIIIVIVITIASFIFWQNGNVDNLSKNTNNINNNGTVLSGNKTLNLSNQELKSIPSYVFNQTNLDF